MVGRAKRPPAGRGGHARPGRQHHGQRDGRYDGGPAGRRAPARPGPLAPFAPFSPFGLPAAMAEEAGHDPGLPYVPAPLRNAAIAAGLLRPNAWPMLFVELNHTNPSSP